MSQLSTGEDVVRGRHVALLAFADLRRTQDRNEPDSEIAVMEAESTMSSSMQRIHDCLTEAEQMLIYRFFLTAVHRNSSVADRYAPHVISSMERQAAMWAEFDDLTEELDEIIHQLSEEAVPLPGLPATLLAADFVWSLAWWVHTRRDVLSFASIATQDAATLASLGRPPSPQDPICLGVYEQAVAAEAAYRSFRRGEYEGATHVALRPSTSDERMAEMTKRNHL